MRGVQPGPDWTQVPKGTPFHITGSKGVFHFQYFRNGEVTLYGGIRAKDEWIDACFRTVKPESLKPPKRR